MSVNVTNIFFISPPTEIRHPGKKSDRAPPSALTLRHSKTPKLHYSIARPLRALRVLCVSILLSIAGFEVRRSDLDVRSLQRWSETLPICDGL